MFERERERERNGVRKRKEGEKLKNKTQKKIIKQISENDGPFTKSL